MSDSDDMGSAARALSAAVVALTRAVGQGLTEAGREITDEIVAELRQASDELADTSTKVVAVGAGRRRPKTRKTATDKTATKPSHGTPADRRRARAEQTRAQLLAAAATVFAEKGYEGSSVGDVAAEAGYTKGAVYVHFDSKEDLLAGIVAQMAETDEEFFATGPTSVSALFCSGDDDPETLRRTLLALEVYTYAVRHPEARSRMAPLVASTWDHAARLLAANRTGDQGTQDVVPSQDDRDLALVLLSVHTFAQMIGPVLGDGTAPASAARTVDRLLAAQTADAAAGPQAGR
ncbi:MAG: TetR/AcrR family transcriptional regulator [Micrococcales bacterium]|nr:TetR/AcrR family transcriptional regulator [Micrococcales bacterium]